MTFFFSFQWRVSSLLLALFLVTGIAFQPPQSRQSNRQHVGTRTAESSRHQHRFVESLKASCRGPCEDSIEGEHSDSSWLSRREAVFATLGGLWASWSLPTSLLVGSARPAHAAYGSDAKIELPNMMQGMSDRVNKQCLVESLGNRECLVYMEDSERFIYKGANGDQLLERIQVSVKARRHSSSDQQNN